MRRATANWVPTWVDSMRTPTKQFNICPDAHQPTTRARFRLIAGSSLANVSAKINRASDPRDFTPSNDDRERPSDELQPRTINDSNSALQWTPAPRTARNHLSNLSHRVTASASPLMEGVVDHPSRFPLLPADKPSTSPARATHNADPAAHQHILPTLARCSTIIRLHVC